MKKYYLLLLGVSLICFSCSKETISEDVSNFNEEKIAIGSDVEGANSKFERKNYCSNLIINAPDNYYLKKPLPEISGLNYTAISTSSEYASPPLQDAFLSQIASSLNLSNDDIFVLFIESPSQAFIDATDGISPILIKFNDSESNGSYSWLDGNPISQVNLTDVFLTAKHTIENTILNDSSINGIDKLMIYVDAGLCSSEIVFEFSVWYN
ncbi:hypothetical protein [Xanthomarina gelatinilytica]|jgi:hypothetical protein|uniref:hypothetical protein n=1 Tax=Xanthomarina gelatinilytica TaxID=1137281 RepID=UPI003AA963B9